MEAVCLDFLSESEPKTSNDVPDFLTDVRLTVLSGSLLVAGAVNRVEIFPAVREAGCGRAMGALGEETVSIIGLRSVRVSTEACVFTATNGVITVRETEDVFGFAFSAEETEEVRVETLTRFELLLFLSAVLTTSTVRFTRRAGTALLLCCVGCEGVC